MNPENASKGTILTLAAVSALMLLMAMQHKGFAQNTEPKASLRIGVYDSRAVAVAFAGSEPFKKWMGNLRAEHEKAKAAGNSKRVAQLEAEGAASQRLLHMQGFSTAPVTNILASIQDRLPAIKDKAGVSVLMSKWDEAGLAQHKDAESVDVTMALVDAFHPTDGQRKSAVEIQKHPPIPLDQAERIKD